MMDAFRNNEVYADGHLVVTSAVSVCIYFDVLDEEQSQGLVQLWNLVLPIFKPRLRWYFTDQMAEKQPVDSDTFEMVPLWLHPSEHKRNYYVFQSQGGSDQEGVDPWNIELWISNPERVQEEARPLMTMLFNVLDDKLDKHANCLRLCFPVNPEECDISQVVLVSNYVFDNMPFIHGYAGYSLIFDSNSSLLKREAWSNILRIAFRHPGYDIFDYTASESFVYDKMKTISWLTLLGPTFGRQFHEMGRAKYLDNKDIKVITKNDKVLIQVGEKPEIGDINRGNDLPLYKKVAKAIEPFFCDTHWPFSRIFDEEKTLQWLRRFHGH